jgi:hypothetical protein
MDMPYFFVRNRSAVRRAQVRHGGPGSIVESVVPDPGLRYGEAEKALLDTAKENGIRPSDKTIEISGDPGKAKDRGLVSYPGSPARARTRRDSD